MKRKSKEMSLPVSLLEFIKRVGDDEAARLFYITTRTIRSYRYFEKMPSATRVTLMAQITKYHPAGRITKETAWEGMISQEDVDRLRCY